MKVGAILLGAGFASLPVGFLSASAISSTLAFYASGISRQGLES